MKSTIDEIIEEMKANSESAGYRIIHEISKALYKDIEINRQYNKRLKILCLEYINKKFYKNNRLVKRLKKTNQKK